MNPDSSLLSLAARIIVTGGTFDKHYDAIKGELTFKNSHLPAILEQSRVTIDRARDQTADRQSQHAGRTPRTYWRPAARTESCIVVIHGTDTMAQTAQVVGGAGLAKTIVFTGAMIPYSVQGSDALFNLGFALAAAQSLPHNTYVAMNGRVFQWDQVKKNKLDGVFETPAGVPATPA
jgi:L-asparaginase